MRMAPLPKRIEGGAGPAKNHVAARKNHYQGNGDHAKGRSSNMGDGVERDLTAEGGGLVAAQFGDERMRGFVTSG